MTNKKKTAPQPCTDAGNAEWIAALFGDALRYDHKQSRWLIWSKRRRWIEDKANEVRKFAIAAARRRLRAAARLADTNKSKAEIKWAFASEDRYRVDAALDIAKSLPPISDLGDGWDADPWLFGVANGIVDLRTGKLCPATQQDRITKFSPVVFDPNATCPRFEQFVREIFGGDVVLICYVQKAAGYSLTGSVQEQCIFILYGPGANGKTTLVEILLYVMGDYGDDLPISVLEAKRNGSAPGEAVKLPGLRFAKSVEIREGRRLDEARVKALTGGDTISVRPLYHNAFSFRPTHKLWLAVNHKPVITDNSPAMWRRIRLIPFLCTFEGQQADKRLLEKLKAEAPGILNWMIQGCMAWQKEGLEPPPPVQEATREYQEDSDPLSAFVKDRCEAGDGFEVGRGELYDAYRKWCEDNDQEPLKIGDFKSRMSQRFVPDRSGHGGKKVWKGLRLPDVAGDGVGCPTVSGDSHSSPIEPATEKVSENLDTARHQDTVDSPSLAELALEP